MFFCENDGTMLRKKIKDQEKLIYYCVQCEAEYDVDEVDKNNQNKNQNCIFKHNYNSKKLSYKTYINDNIFHDPSQN
jgi:DNA-directed RNA polymerase subunit M/transcription elongation factor TFIIS